MNNNTASMTMKPRLDITWNAEITYKICNSSGNPVCEYKSSTYPYAAINKTRLDEQSEDPIDPQRSTSSIQVFPY